MKAQPLGCADSQHPFAYSPPFFVVPPSFVNDLDRPFRHPCLMIRNCVTPVHHLMIMVSPAAFDSVVRATSPEYALARVSHRSGS
jgi:hypothetical protein